MDHNFATSMQPKLGAEVDELYVREEDIAELCKVLGETFSHDQTIRHHAEQQLKSIEQSPGLPLILLNIIRRPTLDTDIRLAAAIFLKNEIRRHWNEQAAPPSGVPDVGHDATGVAAANASKTAGVYNDAQKAIFRRYVFDILVDVSDVTRVRNMVEESLRLVVQSDFPEAWPEILQIIESNLRNFRSVPERRVLCSLMALRRLTGNFELRTEREHLNVVIQTTFPLVLPLAEYLMTDEASPDGSNRLVNWTASPSKAMMIKLICKVYWSSTQMALARGGEVDRTVDHWMRLMERILTTPIEKVVIDAVAVCDEDTRSRLEPVKTKKQAMQIIHRFFSRYGTDKDDYKAFGKKFVDNWSCRFLSCCLELLKKNNSSEWFMSKRIHSLTFQYLTQAVEMSKTYKFLKPHCNELLREYCFPLLCYTDEDEELWDFDPVDFVRSHNDFQFAFADPKEAAIEFVQKIAKLRARDFLSHLQQIAETALTRYTADTNNPKSKESCREKDGALHLLGSISNRLAAEKRKNPIGHFLVTHVFSDFNNPNKFLRLRACATAQEFLTPSAGFGCIVSRKAPAPQFDDNSDLVHAFHGMLMTCGDSELPVRIQAGMSIKSFFEVATQIENEVLRNAIISSLPEIVRRLFALMSDMDNEWVVATLQSLIENFEDEVIPYAVQLTAALQAALVRLICVSDDSENVVSSTGGAAAASIDDQDSLTTGMSIAETILSILTSSDFKALKDPTTVTQLVGILAPLFDCMIHPDNPDFLDEGLRMLGYLVCYAPVPLDATLWKCFERVHSALCGGRGTPGSVTAQEIFKYGWAPDYMKYIVPLAHNYLIRDPQTFALGRSSCDGRGYLELIIEMAAHGLKDEEDSDGPKQGLELLVYLFEAYLRKSDIDSFMKPAFELQWQCLKEQPMTSSSKGMLLRVWLVMMLYNVKLFISMLVEGNIVEDVLKQFQDLKAIKTLESKKLFVLAFGELLSFAACYPAECPPVIVQSMIGIARQLAEQQQQLAALKKKLADGEESSDGSYETEDSEEDLGEDDDATDKETKLIQAIRASEAISTASEDEEEDDEDDDSYETDDGFEDIKCTSPLEEVDELIVFSDMLTKHRAIFLEALGVNDLAILDSNVSQQIAAQREKTATAVQ